MRKIFVLVLFAITALYGAGQEIQLPNGQTITASGIDNLIKTLMDTADVTGLQLGVINNNRPAYVKSYGYKNAPAKQLNDTATCFYGASLAKPLFAYLVMQLVQQGLIDLDKPLYTYLPSPISAYPKYTDLANDERWKLITARHCLDHTTGFPNWREFNPHGNKKLEIFFTPGTRYAYSGEGLYVLQMVIEVITGKGLEELAQENIFRPFGMYRSSFLWQPAFETDYALGHDMNGDVLRKSKRTTPNAAGSMETTVADYTRFLSAVLQQQRLSEKSWNELFTPQIRIRSLRQFPSLDTATTHEYDGIGLSYGLGWGLFNSAYGKVFFKEGHDDGWVHYTIAFPEKKMAFVFMCNSSSGESIFKELTEKLTGVTIPYIWEAYFPYRANITMPENVLKDFTGTYTGRLQADITMENGRLKIASPTVKLAKTNLYATNDHHFFLKTMEAEVDFLRDEHGQVYKALVVDEGEKYELKKIMGDSLLMTGPPAIPSETITQYTGRYQVGDHVLVVSSQKGKLFILSTNPKDKLSNLELVPISLTEFYLKEAPISCVFLSDASGKVNRIRVTVGGQPPAELIKL